MRQLKLAARLRESKGKGAARKLRRNQQIPAIFYGPGTAPLMLTVAYPEMERVIKLSGGENPLLDLQIETDQGEETRKVMLKELTREPIRSTYLHADFYEIAMDKEITVEIPVRLVHTPVGVTNGGILESVRRGITVSCLPDRLIDAIDVDVSHLEIGDAIHIRDIGLPEGITCEDEGDLTVAVVSAPGVGEEEERGVEEEMEGEPAGAEKASAEGSEDERKGGEQ